MLVVEQEKFRNVLINITSSSYLFTSDNKLFPTLDAKSFGNETRFINHMPEEGANCEVKQIKFKNRNQVLLFACKDIKQGEELFFDYGNDFNIEWKTK